MTSQCVARPVEHSEIVTRVQFFADKLVTADSTGTMCVWSLQPLMHLLTKVSAHASTITCLDSCQQSGRIVSGGGDQRVKLWDVSQDMKQLPAEYDVIWGVSWLPDGQLAVLACRNGTRAIEVSDQYCLWPNAWLMLSSTDLAILCF